MELTGKQATTIAVCAAFIVAGILTIAAVLDDEEGTTSTGQVTVENRDSMAMAGDEVVKDSFIINDTSQCHDPPARRKLCLFGR